MLAVRHLSKKSRLLLQVCGISYKRGVRSNILPEVEADADRTPEPYLMQIVKKPRPRQERKPITRFKLFTPVGLVSLSLCCSCWCM